MMLEWISALFCVVDKTSEIVFLIYFLMGIS